MEKVFVTAENTATFSCPECERSRTVDVARYKEIEKAVRIKVKCPCGHDYLVALERRRQFRKPVHFKGTCERIGDGRTAAKAEMVVVDISRTGLKLRLLDGGPLRVGDRAVVEFRMDDPKRSFVRMEVLVRKVDGREVGVEFTSQGLSDPNVKAIGFYLFG
jgi:hypothetical protein